jgi:NhaP-type Na+/H+ or K+/H+ antiporter/Trk K+ transport system NAD-binding subunit
MDNAALLTIVWATAAGLLAQVVAARFRFPSIVLLLAIGIGLGPSALDFVRPATMGSGLPVLVKLTVAVILFDGALNLRVSDLRRAAADVRNLVTTGLVVTWAGATAAAYFIAELSLGVAIVFGAVVTVTGPTVVQPLLKRMQLSRPVRTTLSGEAILIDPIGALLAVAVLDVVLGVAGAQRIGILGGAWGYVGRLLVGGGIGIAGGMALSFALRRPRLVPEGYANLLALGSVWAVFGAAEALLPEAGIMAAVAMGLAVQRGAVPDERRLRQFKEQLTTLGIGLLFVLLAAGLPLDVTRAEGWRGILTVAALMFVVRPLAVTAALRGSALSWREKLFIAWVAPRGIVAASMASVFALALAGAGVSEGPRLLSLTFLTIGMTVTIQGLTAGPLARALGLESLGGRHAIVVGAGPLGRAVAGVLRGHGRPVTLVDRSAMLVLDARTEGFDVVAGNALDEETLERAGAEEAETLVAVTTNPEVNALAAQIGHEVFGIGRAFPALDHPSLGANPRLLERAGGRMAFGRTLDIRRWERLLDRGDAAVIQAPVPESWAGRWLWELELAEEFLVLARIRGDSVEIATAEQGWQRGDEAVLLSRAAADVVLPEAPERARAAPPAGTATRAS